MLSRMKRNASTAGLTSKKTYKKKKTATPITPRQRQLLSELSTREIKYRDTVVANTTLNIATSVSAWNGSYILMGNLSHVPVGDEINTRTGRKIGIKSVRINLSVNWTAGSSGIDYVIPGPVRWMLIVDKQCNGNFANQTTQTQVYTANGVNAMMNTECFGRYKVLQDKIVNPPQVGGNLTTVGGSNYFAGCFNTYKIKHKFKKPMIVNFNNLTNGDVRDIVDNNIFFQIGAGSLQVPIVVNAYARISYSDL